MELAEGARWKVWVVEMELAEGARWKESIITLNDSLTILVGDVMLAAAFVSYIGCFNKRFRIELMTKSKSGHRKPHAARLFQPRG